MSCALASAAYPPATASVRSVKPISVGSLSQCTPCPRSGSRWRYYGWRLALDEGHNEDYTSTTWLSVGRGLWLTHVARVPGELGSAISCAAVPLCRSASLAVFSLQHFIFSFASRIPRS